MKDPTRQRSFLKESLFIAIFVISSTLIMVLLDAYELIHIYSRELEGYEFDEIIIFLPFFFTIGLLWFSYRRLQDLKLEINQRNRAEEELIKFRDHLRELVKERTAELTKTNELLQREIEDRKQAERALQQSKNQLEQTLSELKITQAQMVQSEKMASIGQLAAGIAHEINNPVGFVSSNLTTLLDYQDDISMIIGEYKRLITNLKDAMTKDECISLVSEQVKDILSLETKIDLKFLLNDIQNLIKERVPHTNLWVNSGIGRRPGPWYIARVKASDDR